MKSEGDQRGPAGKGKGSVGMGGRPEDDGDENEIIYTYDSDIEKPCVVSD